MLAPKLRFKEFNDKWKKIKLKKLLKFKNGINASKESYGHGVKYISVGDILNNNYITYDNIKGLVDIDENTLNENAVHYGDIVFQRSSETFEDIGQANVYLDQNKIATFGGFVIRGKKISDYDPIFFYYLLKSPLSRKSIIVKGAGAQHYNISQEELEKISLYFPNLYEQQKIGKFLSVLDKKIELQQRKIEVLKMYKRGLMQKIFDNTEINNWSTNILRNILIPGSKVPVTDTSKYQKITIKLNLQGITKSNVNREMADTRPFYIRRENEIIIGKQNYFNGSIAILPKEFDGCICSNAIMSFSVNSNYLTKFVYYYISQNNYIKRREYFANGTGQKELSENDFLNFQIKAPSMDEQKHITNILDTIDSKINSNVNIYNSLTKLKKSLLQQMFI